MLLLRGGDAVPAVAGDQHHAAGGPSLPEGRGPDDREGEAWRAVCVCARARASSGIGGTLPAHPPTVEPCAGWICTPYNPSPEARALLSSLSSWAGWVRVKEGWRGIILFLLE